MKNKLKNMITLFLLFCLAIIVIAIVGAVISAAQILFWPALFILGVILIVKNMKAKK